MGSVVNNLGWKSKDTAIGRIITGPVIVRSMPQFSQTAKYIYIYIYAYVYSAGENEVDFW